MAAQARKERRDLEQYVRVSGGEKTSEFQSSNARKEGLESFSGDKILVKEFGGFRLCGSLNVEGDIDGLEADAWTVTSNTCPMFQDCTGVASFNYFGKSKIKYSVNHCEWDQKSIALISATGVAFVAACAVFYAWLRQKFVR